MSSSLEVTEEFATQIRKEADRVKNEGVSHLSREELEESMQEAVELLATGVEIALALAKSRRRLVKLATKLAMMPPRGPSEYEAVMQELGDE